MSNQSPEIIFTIIIVLLTAIICGWLFKAMFKIKFYSAACFALAIATSQVRSSILRSGSGGPDATPNLLNDPHNRWVLDFLNSNLCYLVVTLSVVVTMLWFIYDVARLINRIEKVLEKNGINTKLEPKTLFYMVYNYAKENPVLTLELFNTLVADIVREKENQDLEGGTQNG